jgi:hypothetical protein
MEDVIQDQMFGLPKGLFESSGSHGSRDICNTQVWFQRLLVSDLQILAKVYIMNNW